MIVKTLTHALMVISRASCTPVVCGHGDPEQSYIMFKNRAIVKGPVAYEFIIEYKKSLLLEEAYKRLALKRVRDLRDSLSRPGESPSDMDLTGLYV